jgi:cell division protein FtsB
MNPTLRVILLVLFLGLSLAVATAQESTSVANLRSQLVDVQAKEDELQVRVKQLDKDLRPENIEKFFALNGSTHPEELREQRRRQLENQKALLQTQIGQLSASRVRLEAGIAAAEAAAYRQSAVVESYNPPAAVSGASTTVARPKQSKRRVRRQRALPRRRRG